MIDNMEGLPDKEVKRRFQLWLKPSVLDMADDLYAKDNCGSRSEFIEKAIQFYAGYLYAQQSQDYFPRVITSTLKGIMADSTNKISRILFKLAVEQPFSERQTPRENGFAPSYPLHQQEETDDRDDDSAILEEQRPTETVDESERINPVEPVYIPSVARSVSALMAQLTRLFQEQDQQREKNQHQQIDRKQRREISEKKQAMGIRN